MNQDTSDDDWLIDDGPGDQPSSGASASALPPWRVLVVDDEPDVHAATRLAFAGMLYKGRAIEVMSAHTAAEGFATLQAIADVALVLLDVVMETDDAGLRLARKIREELDNQLVRVVLRTGQPGQAPERDVILQYDINDYKSKTELTSQKLYTTVISSLRAYESLLVIERNRQGLERILDAATNLYQARSLQAFASGVLSQICAVLDVGAGGAVCLLMVPPESPTAGPQVVAATGGFSGLLDESVSHSDHPLLQSARTAFVERSTRFDEQLDVVYVSTPQQHDFVVLVSPPWPLAELQRKLLHVYCDKIGWAFDNLHVFDALRRSKDQLESSASAVLQAIQTMSPNNLQPALDALVGHLNTHAAQALDPVVLEKRLRDGLASRVDHA